MHFKTCTLLAPDLDEVIALLPSPQHALSAITYYCGYVSWYMHLVHLPSFEKKWAHLTAALSSGDDTAGSNDEAVDPFFMATFLGICATGLSMMPAKRAMRDGFDSDKAATVEQWLDAAMLALRCGRFVEAPTLESIRATTILAAFRAFMSTGEAFGTGMALLGLASQAAISIGLHRDPDRSPGRYTLFEAKERRRLFHSLFTLSVLSSSAVARTWTIFDLKMIDVMLPIDAHDEEIENEDAANIALEARARSFSETPMTSVIAKMQLAIISKRIGDAAFGVRGVSYRTVLDFDYVLSHFELSLPECYQVKIDSYGSLLRSTPHITVVEMRTCMLQMSLGTEYLRLHRPFLLVAASNDDYKRSKMQCVLYAKRLLAIIASPSCSQQPWGGLTSKAIAAAVVLAMTCLAFPNDPEIDLFPGLVHRAASQMERHQAASLISKKGAAVLRFLLTKIAAASAAHVHEPTGGIKRVRSANTAFNLHRTNQYSSQFHHDFIPTSSRRSAEDLTHTALEVDLSAFLGSDVFEFGSSNGESPGVDFSFRCP
ncbi:BQ2448_235 [Microbotryum intermedium]|uniref:BQ2448_235 protein n=1 Tax=Microbotryum intermedium TaxID=269621 RepID=A0A238F8B9_9BASI|nr:BQ2448_235 [Microbotryum intermedium]